MVERARRATSGELAPSHSGASIVAVFRRKVYQGSPGVPKSKTYPKGEKRAEHQSRAHPKRGQRAGAPLILLRYLSGYPKGGSPWGPPLW
jgi:hypothetical protein